MQLGRADSRGSGSDPLIVLGSPINGQFWYRDPADPFMIGLSEAVEFFVGP